MHPSHSERAEDVEVSEAARLAGLLTARGIDTRNVAGGMRAWQAAGLPIVAGGRPPDAPE